MHGLNYSIDFPGVFKPDSPTPRLRAAASRPYRMFARYGFRAMPVVGSNGKFLGAVKYRDVMSLTHHFLE